MLDEWDLLDSEGRTPFRVAEQSGHEECARALKSHMKPFEYDNTLLHEQVEAVNGCMGELMERINQAKKELQDVKDDSAMLLAFITSEAQEK